MNTLMWWESEATVWIDFEKAYTLIYVWFIFKTLKTLDLGEHFQTHKPRPAKGLDTLDWIYILYHLNKLLKQNMIFIK